MGLADTVRSLVATANSITSDLQETITVYPWIGVNMDTESIFGDGVSMTAIVERGRSIMLERDGRTLFKKGTKVTIIGPVTANGAANREEPIDPRDRFVLADGTAGPVVDIKGLDDPSTGKPYLYEVFIGG